MKKIFLTLAFFLFLNYGLNAQDKFSDITVETETFESSNAVKQKCRKFNIGINILVTWASTDVYVYCGFPPGAGAGGTTCLLVDEDFCKLVGTARTSEPTKFLNVKKIIPNADLSQLKFVEVTESSTWIDEDTKQKSSVKLGKYPVDKEGNFEIIILE